MAHRDDREALRAKVDALQRELADTHDALDQERQRKRAPRRSLTDRLTSVIAWVVDRAARTSDYVFARSPGWTPVRAWSFAVIAAVVLGTTLIAMVVWGAAEGDAELTNTGIAVIVWCFVGPPTLIAIAARALGAPGHALGTGAASLAPIFLCIFALNSLPWLSDAPRLLIGGRAAGTVEAVSASPRAAWASITPAYVWASHVRTGVTTRIENGHNQSSSESASPIVPTIPWDGEVSLFACGDADTLREAGPGNGVIAGRVERATFNAATAISELRSAGIRVGPQPRCVRPTLGDVETTFALGALSTVLCLALLTFGGAWSLMRIAATKTVSAAR